jgi:hypothetical protein
MEGWMDFNKKGKNKEDQPLPDSIPGTTRNMLLRRLVEKMLPQANDTETPMPMPPPIM